MSDSVLIRGASRFIKRKTGKLLATGILALLPVILFIPLFFLIPFLDTDNKEILPGGGAGGAAFVVAGEIAFQEITPQFIINWLQRRDSALATMEFANACIKAGRRYNVNPLLLVAITGQEQSFCPAGSPAAMLRNPWNTFGSWQNTDHPVEKSAMYAAECIARLSGGRPEGFHPVAWLNSTDNKGGMYATDPNWWKGVSAFFRELRTDHGDPPPLISGKFIFPIQTGYFISSSFGEMRSTGPHTGVDFACPLGTPIYAMADGVISGLVQGDPIGGNEVFVSGTDGRTYAYLHCSHFAAVQVGQAVKAGDMIAYVGSTGRSTGPHLHLGVKENGRWIDGLKLLK